MIQSPVSPTLSQSEAVVDQSFTEPWNLSSNINEAAAYIAQTYTAGLDGYLAGVSIDVHSKRVMNPGTGCNFYRLHVAICTVHGGYPGAVLTETLLDTDEAKLDTIIRFSDAVPQIAGKQYAIVVHYADAPPAGVGQMIGRWRGATDNCYPDGESCHGPDGKVWFISSLNNFDVHFRTYVVSA